MLFTLANLYGIGFSNDFAKLKYSELLKLKNVVGDTSHHDTITGTSKEYVNDDYEKLLIKGQESGHDVMISSLEKLIPTKFMLYDNIITENYKPIVIYNPLAWNRKEYIRLQVDKENICIFDHSGKIIKSQIFETFHQKYELYFETNIPALGYRTYFAKRCDHNNFIKPKEMNGKEFYIENEFLKIKFCNNGRMCSILQQNEEMQLQQDMKYYTSYDGIKYFIKSFFNRKKKGFDQKSGKYIFRPSKDYPDPLNSESITCKVSGEKGGVIQVYQEFSPYAFQIIRLYEGKNFIEIEHLIGNENFPMNRELITR